MWEVCVLWQPDRRSSHPYRAKHRRATRGPVGRAVKLWMNRIALTNHTQALGLSNKHCTLLCGSVGNQRCSTEPAISQVAFERLFGNDLWSQSMCHGRTSVFQDVTSCTVFHFCFFLRNFNITYQTWFDNMWYGPNIKPAFGIQRFITLEIDQKSITASSKVVDKVEAHKLLSNDSLWE